MSKVIVTNLVTLDGFYEGKGRSLDVLFDYFHEDYAGDETFDTYVAERLHTADTLLFSGSSTFLGFKEYWAGRENLPDVTDIRREIARIMNPMKKW